MGLQRRSARCDWSHRATMPTRRLPAPPIMTVFSNLDEESVHEIARQPIRHAHAARGTHTGTPHRHRRWTIRRPDAREKRSARPARDSSVDPRAIRRSKARRSDKERHRGVSACTKLATADWWKTKASRAGRRLWSGAREHAAPGPRLLWASRILSARWADRKSTR